MRFSKTIAALLLTASPASAQLAMTGAGSSGTTFVPPGASFFADFVANNGWSGSGTTTSTAQITVSRASIASIYTVGSSPPAMSTVANNTARLSADDILGLNAGLLIEQSITNGCGTWDPTTAVLGVVGSGGAFPTGTLTTTDSSGLTKTITAKDANGFNVRYTGTAVAGLMELTLCTGTVTAGTKVTAGYTAQLIAGSWTNFGTILPSIEEYTSGAFANRIVYNTFENNHTSGNYLNIDAPWYVEFNNQTIDTLITTAGPALLAINAASGAVDITLRFERPQIDNTTIRTAWQAAASRAADNVTINHPLGATPWSLDLTADSPRESATGTLWQLDDGTNSNYVSLNITNYELFLTVETSGAQTANIDIGPVPTLSRFNVAVGLSSSAYTISLNGYKITGSVTVPAGLTTERLGNGAQGYWNGFVQNITHYASKLSDSALVTLSLGGSTYWDNFHRANGAPGTAPTGQVYTTSGTGGGVVTPVITSNLLTAPDSGGAQTAGYTSVDLGASFVPKFFSTIFVLSNATTGNGGLLISNAGGINTITANSLHSYFTDLSVGWTVFVTMPPFTTIDSGFPIAAYVRDGTTKQHYAWALNSTAQYMRTSTGEVQRVPNASFQQQAGEFQILEHFWNTGGCQISFVAGAAR